MLGRLHLIRHGEVFNPDHLVYADLPGFHLSDQGRREAEAAATHLAGQSIDIVVSSPLERAIETAVPIAEQLGVPLRIEPRLTEWRLLTRWAGVVWEDLAEGFPGEVDAYLTHAHDLPFSPEPLDAVVARFLAVVEALGAEHSGATAALVSHQDPVQAARLALTGRPLSELPVDKPRHGTVITLAAAESWAEVGRWDPPLPA
ncbi:MAG: histidine phosphatase family protein [Acidimicrobiia bacterium]|nr:histidine phosphatase family protein [Acidimicrobiia bacterium]